jgi:hypothetical protein
VSMTLGICKRRVSWMLESLELCRLGSTRECDGPPEGGTHPGNAHLVGRSSPAAALRIPDEM